jgi:hypothetical protein
LLFQNVPHKEEVEMNKFKKCCPLAVSIMPPPVISFAVPNTNSAE